MGSEPIFERPLSRRRLLEYAAGGTALGLLLPQGALSAAPVRGGALRTAHVGGGSAESLNPLILPNIIDVARAQQLYELLFFSSPSLKVVPRLGLSLEPNRTATVWQLKLRQGVTFHNGKPFGADDVLYTWHYTVTPKSKAEGAPYLEPLDLAKTRKVSKHEIEVHLKRPIGDLPRLLSSRPLYVIPAGMTQFLKPNGTGPFKFVSWTQGVRSKFVRNEHYWESGKPYVDSVEMLSIPDSNARLNALLGGQVDAIEALNYSQARAQKGNSAIHVVNAVSPGAPAMTMRLDAAPFNDQRVREALRLAVDRKQMVDIALLGFGAVGNDLFGRGYPSYNSSLSQRTYDPEQAKALLKKAGHDGLTVTLYTANGVIPGLFESATAYAQQAKKAGINVVLRQLSADAYFNPSIKYLHKSAPFYQTFWQESFEAQATDALLHNSAFRGETMFNNPGWEKRFRKAQGVADEARRDALYKELQGTLYHDDGYIVWGFANFVDAVSRHVQGVATNPLFNLGYFEYKNWWLSK
jgi:peptide/nickel transport system substrate-binding protein